MARRPGNITRPDARLEHELQAAAAFAEDVAAGADHARAERDRIAYELFHDRGYTQAALTNIANQALIRPLTEDAFQKAFARMDRDEAVPASRPQEATPVPTRERLHLIRSNAQEVTPMPTAPTSTRERLIDCNANWDRTHPGPWCLVQDGDDYVVNPNGNWGEARGPMIHSANCFRFHPETPALLQHISWAKVKDYEALRRAGGPITFCDCVAKTGHQHYEAWETRPMTQLEGTSLYDGDEFDAVSG